MGLSSNATGEFCLSSLAIFLYDLRIVERNMRQKLHVILATRKMRTVNGGRNANTAHRVLLIARGETVSKLF